MLLGGALSLGGHIGAMYAPTYTLIALALSVAGVGAGFLLYGLNTAIAMSSHAIREYSIVNSVAAIAPIPLPLFMPQLIEEYGAVGSYGLFVAYSLVFFVLLLAMPRIFPQKGAGRVGMGPLSVPKFISLMLTVFLPVVGGISFFAFQDHLGQQLGWSADDMGLVITVSFTGSVLGTALAAWVDDRFGWFIPTALAIIGVCLSAVIGTETRDAWIFAGSVFAYEVFIFMAFPYLLAACARVDATGQVAAMGGGIFFGAIAFGPYIGGYLLDKHGSDGLGLFVVAVCVVSIGLALFLRKEVDMPSSQIATMRTPIELS